MKPVAELIDVPGKSFPALVFADGFRDLPAGTKLYARPFLELAQQDNYSSEKAYLVRLLLELRQPTIRITKRKRQAIIDLAIQEIERAEPSNSQEK